VARCLLTLLAVMVVGMFPVPPGRAWSAELYDFGNPSAQEERMRFLINLARLDPEAEADRLGLLNTHPDDVPDGTYDVGEGMTLQGLPDQRDYWSRYHGPRQVLAWNAALNAAARNHSQDMHQFSFFSHHTQQSSHGYPGPGEGYPGAAPADRAYIEGYPCHFVGENIATNNYAGQYPPQSVHDDLFRDTPIAGRGHRRNILHSFWREVGVGAYSGEPNAEGWTDFWTIDFASDAFRAGGYDDPNPPPETVYLTGVAFDDDGDGQFTPGEQMPGVQVVAWSGGEQLKYYAITADGGGYSIPLLDADGGDLAEGQVVEVAFFDPVRHAYLQAQAAVQGGDVVFEDDDGPTPMTFHQRFNVWVDALAADFSPLLDGDANLDGRVGIADLGALADNYGQTGRVWVHGDFNFDGKVGIADLGAIADNYGVEAGQDRLLVPGPPTALLLAIAGAALVRRRCRRGLSSRSGT